MKVVNKLSRAGKSHKSMGWTSATQSFKDWQIRNGERRYWYMECFSKVVAVVLEQPVSKSSVIDLVDVAAVYPGFCQLISRMIWKS